MNVMIKDFGVRMDRAVFLNDSDVSGARYERQDGAAHPLLHIPSLGTELGSGPFAKAKVGRFLAKAWGLNPNERAVQDAAADFVGSSLKQLLSPSEDVRRGEDDPFIFAPRPGRTPILPSRPILEPGMRSWAYKIRAPVGEAQFVEPNAVSSLQLADYVVDEKEQGARYYGVAYALEIPETWEAKHLGEDPLGERESSATLAMDNFREMVSFIGSDDGKIPGFATFPDALLVLGGVPFSGFTLSAVQMLQRMATWESEYRTANRGMRPTHVLAPHSDLIALQTIMFANTATSCWSLAVEMFPWLKNATWDDRMDTANPDGGHRWIFWSQNPKDTFIEHSAPMVFGPWEERMRLTFILLRRTGGFVAKIPERVMYVDFA
jgi:hypothetical protein